MSTATIPWEQYQKLPPDKRSRPLTDEEYAHLTPSQLGEPDEGAPADFGGTVLPNPTHIRPQLDTDPAIPATRLPRGVTFQHENWHGKLPEDISNPAAADVQPAMEREARADFGKKMSGPAAAPWEKYSTKAGTPASAPAGPWARFAPKPPAAAKTKEPGFLDKEIPLGGPWYNPTLSGLQSVGRGIRGAGEGLYNTIRHPIDTVTGTARGIGEIPSTLKQLPAAIHDINASPDPLSHYAHAAQETAGQGAGQALTALATEGLIKAAPTIARVAKPIAARGLTMASDIVDPELTGVISPRLANAQKLAGRVGKALSKGTEEPRALPELDATGENKPFAGGLDEPKPARPLDATGENKPFAGGMDEYVGPKTQPSIPQDIARPADIARPIPSPSETAQGIRYFRARNIGEEGIPYRSPGRAQATASQTEASERIAPLREETEGAPQEIITGNLAETPGFSVRPGPNGPNWYTFHGDVPESGVTRIARPTEAAAEARPLPIPGEAPDPLLERLRSQAEKIQTAEPHVPGQGEDLTDLGIQSVARAKAMRNLGEPSEVPARPPETEEEFKARLAAKSDALRTPAR